MSVNLADVSNGQTVYIYAPTILSYTINQSSGSIVKQEFFLNNELLNADVSTIHLNPQQIPSNPLSNLKVKIQLTSGTGSLAEILGEERSDFEFNYPLKYVNPDIDLNIRQLVNEDKNLEIFWDKPVLEGAEIESYEIYNFSNLNEILIEKITDANKTSFTDIDYVYGAKTYKIITKYKSEKVSAKEDFYSVQYEPFTSQYFKASSPENLELQIKWEHPDGIKSKYVLRWKDEVKMVDVGQNSSSVSRPGFPMLGEQYYELYILPEYASFSNYEQYPKVINYFKELNIGEEYLGYRSSIWFEGDIKSQSLLGVRPHTNGYGFRRFAAIDLKETFNTPNGLTDPFYFSNFTVSPTTGRVAIHFRSNDYNVSPKIDVYSDYTLSKFLRSFSTDDFPVYFLTDDDKIIISNNDRYFHRIYDINNGKLLSTMRETSESSQQFRPAISADGKYIMNYLGIDDAWYKLYQYDNGVATLLKTQRNSRINNIIFHPTRQQQVILQSSNNYFTICEVPSLNKIATIQGEFVSIDPFTGNILYQDKEFDTNAQLNVLDKDYQKTIYKITSGNIYYYYYARLLNNNLIVDNHYINIIK